MVVEFAIKEAPEVSKEIEKKLEDYLKWYELFNRDNVQIVEYSQGQDGSSTALEGGVCAALSLDIDTKLLQDPKKPLQELNLNSIPQRIRYDQARYLVGRQLNKETCKTGIFTDQFLNDKNVEQKFYKFCKKKENGSYDKDLVSPLLLSVRREPNDIFQSSNPALYLGLNGKGWGHAIYIRFDKNEKRFIFYDPNFLTAELKDVELREGLSWLRDILNGLLENHYDDIVCITAHQTLNK